MVKKTVIPATKKTGKELLKDNSKVLRVCAYVRVSTDTEEQLESFNAQIGRYKRIICEDHKDDWEFAGIFADTESGTTIEKREEFQDMMDKCRAGKIDLILVKQMSRFGRNTINTLQAIYELRGLGVEIWFENDDIFGSNPRLDFMLTMLSGLAQEEARQQSLRVSSGIRERMESGNIAKRIRPIFGFRKDITDTIYVYEPEAILVRIVFLLYASGIKTHDIAMMAARDFPKDYTNGLSRPHLYDGYLLNTRYKGTVVLQKTFKPNYISQQVKRNKGERPMYIYENYHKAIIPSSFYEYANSRRGNKTFEIVNDSFSSFLYCGLCTRNLKPVKKYGRRKGESYYSCNVYQDHRIIYCDLKYQDGKVLEDIVDDILGQLADIETLINKVKCQLIC